MECIIGKKSHAVYVKNKNELESLTKVNILDRLHMVVTSEIKKGLNLANYAKADTNNGDVHLAGKLSPRISIPFILENVKDISEFIKRIPIEKILDNNYFSKTNANYSSPLTDDPNARKSKDDTIYDGMYEDGDLCFGGLRTRWNSRHSYQVNDNISRHLGAYNALR